MRPKLGMLVLTGILVLGVSGMLGCATTPTQQGALIGGASGAGLGAIIGNNSGNHNGGQGALIGAAGGALAGALVGDAVDENRQKKTQKVTTETSGQTVSGHYENREVKTQAGETYMERVWVPDR